MSSSRAVACCCTSSRSWSCVVGRCPGDASRSASARQNDASDWKPCWAALAWYAAGAHAAKALYRRIAAWNCFPLLGVFIRQGQPHQGGGLVPYHARVEVLEHFVHFRRRHRPVGILLGSAQPGRRGGFVLCGGDRCPQAALDWCGVGVLREEVARSVALGGWVPRPSPPHRGGLAGPDRPGGSRARPPAAAPFLGARPFPAGTTAGGAR